MKISPLNIKRLSKLVTVLISLHSCLFDCNVTWQGHNSHVKNKGPEKQQQQQKPVVAIYFPGVRGLDPTFPLSAMRVTSDSAQFSLFLLRFCIFFVFQN